MHMHFIPNSSAFENIRIGNFVRIGNYQFWRIGNDWTNWKYFQFAQNFQFTQNFQFVIIDQFDVRIVLTELNLHSTSPPPSEYIFLRIRTNLSQTAQWTTICSEGHISVQKWSLRGLLSPIYPCRNRFKTLTISC